MHDDADNTPTAPTVLAEGRFLRMVKDGRWEYCERHTCRGAVAVVAMTDDHQLVLVEQYRVPLGKPCIELPAGLAGDLDDAADETFADAAGRELLEETGYRAAQIDHLFTVATSPGLTNETIDLYRATGLTQEHKGGGVSHEEITVHLIPRDQASAWLQTQQDAGKAVDTKTYLAVHLAGTGR